MAEVGEVSIIENYSRLNQAQIAASFPCHDRVTPRGRDMDLYLVRHADALALGERGITEDAERPLSEEGQAQAKSVGAGLQRMGVHLNLIVSSPLVRARQTTEGLVREWAAPA